MELYIYLHQVLGKTLARSLYSISRAHSLLNEFIGNAVSTVGGLNVHIYTPWSVVCCVINANSIRAIHLKTEP